MVMKHIQKTSDAATPSNTIHVRVSRATERIWEGDAISISSTNSHGAFDILPQHANFVTLIKDSNVLVQDVARNIHTFTFKQCVLHVHTNMANIYADIT